MRRRDDCCCGGFKSNILRLLVLSFLLECLQLNWTSPVSLFHLDSTNIHQQVWSIKMALVNVTLTISVLGNENKDGLQSDRTH